MAGKTTDVIVVGGGAAGMAAAIACAHRSKLVGQNKNITLLEHNEKLGRKLSATGNGKCNYTNKLQTMECYHGTDEAVIKEVLEQFGVEDTLSFFRELGIYPKEKNGYYYPFSEQAASIIEAMRLELEHLKVKIKCREHIVKVEKQDEEFLVSTETYTYRAPKVILATGGLAAPKLGSDGKGYDFAKGFGHTVSSLHPALTGLKTKEDFNALAGIRVKAEIRLYVGIDKVVVKEEAKVTDRVELKKSGAEESAVKCYKETGELQLTAYGISGIPVFQLSRFAAVGLAEKKKVSAAIDFLPEFSFKELCDFVRVLKEQNSYKTAGTLFNGLLDSKLTTVLLKKCHIDKNKKAEDLTEDELLGFCRCTKEFICAIIDTNGFENAQVTAGGVNLLEINPKTMESKKVSGLYLTGELLDVDGICGGYNLQWAWATGYLAGTAAGR